jgi:16S rRNA (uracil1498-N3)-methyltransferase
MRRRFYVEKFEGDTAALQGEAAHHLGLVLRAQPGQLFELSDGKTVQLGKVKRVERDSIEFTLVEGVPSNESPLVTTLLLSIVKFDRFEWALEKATELGVASVIPIVAGRSEKSLVSAAAKRAERWNKILVESAQQSRRLRPPVLHSATRLADAIHLAGGDGGKKPGARIMLSERAEAVSLREILSGFTRESTTSATIAIGPEGGWTDGEFKAVVASGFVEASLGNNILRTETAVVAALASINLVFG